MLCVCTLDLMKIVLVTYFLLLLFRLPYLENKKILQIDTFWKREIAFFATILIIDFSSSFVLPIETFTSDEKNHLGKKKNIIYIWRHDPKTVNSHHEMICKKSEKKLERYFQTLKMDRSYRRICLYHKIEFNCVIMSNLFVS